MEEHPSLIATVMFISEWTKGGFIGVLQNIEKENKQTNKKMNCAFEKGRNFAYAA